MLLLLVLCAFISAAGCLLLTRLGRRNARRYAESMPQRFHKGHIPRLGGVGMWFACAFGWLWMVVAERYLPVTNSIVFSAHTAAVWFLTEPDRCRVRAEHDTVGDRQITLGHHHPQPAEGTREPHPHAAEARDMSLVESLRHGLGIAAGIAAPQPGEQEAASSRDESAKNEKQEHP